MNVLISMTLALIIWSLYPLAAVYGLESMNYMEIIFYVYLWAAIGSTIICFVYLALSKRLRQTWEIQRSLPFKAYGPAFLSGLFAGGSHALFIISLTMTDKAAASLLFEAWPVIALVATPLLMKKKWKKVSFKEFCLGGFALLGVVIVILSDEKLFSNVQGGASDLSQMLDIKQLGGYILAFLGGYLTALFVLLRGVYAQNFSALNNGIASSLISEFVSRVLGFFFFFIVYFIFQDMIGLENFQNDVFSLPLIFIGGGIFVIGGMLFTYSILNANSPTIHIICYLIPIFAVIWLCLMGKSTLGIGLIIGSVIVVGSNIALYFSQKSADFDEDLEDDLYKIHNR